MFFRKLKHTAFMKFAAFMLQFAPGVSYMAFAGEGSARSLCRHIASNGIRKLLVVTDKPLRELGIVDQALAGLAEQGVQIAIYDGVLPDPTYRMAAEAKALYESEGCDGILAIGGGSSIDAAKVVGVSLTHPGDPSEYVGWGLAKEDLPPFFAIPTTAGTGSEATMGAVISDNDTHEKGIISGRGLLPRAACLDPSLMTGLPPHITAATGMDALTHAVEAYIGIWDRGDSKEKAAAAAKLIFTHLPEACSNGSDVGVREAMAQAAYMAGQAINQVNVGNVHAIAHQLGARYGVPHGQANAMVMPHVLDLCKDAASVRLGELGQQVGCSSVDEFILAIRQLNDSLGLPTKVEGLKSEDFPAIVEGALAEADGYAVPYMMSPDDVRHVLTQLS